MFIHKYTNSNYVSVGCRSSSARFLSASQLQSIDARRVFPCFDEPDMKARFSVSIAHQRGFTALSNMPLVASTNLDDGWIEDGFAVTPVMSTYLLAFVVAEFRHRQTTTEDGLTVRRDDEDLLRMTSYAGSNALACWKPAVDQKYTLPDYLVVVEDVICSRKDVIFRQMASSFE